MQKTKTSKIIFRVCLTAIFIAFAIIVKSLFSIPINIFGANGMKIGFAGVFTSFPAFLFGPIYGGLASSLSDLIGYLIKPDGAYIPWLTLTAFLGGVLKGLIWKLISSRKELKFKVVVLCLSVIIGMFGIVSHICLNHDNVMDGFTAVQSELPTKGQLKDYNLTSISKISTELAKYNNDTITLKSVNSEASELTIPKYAVIDGELMTITKIGADVLADAENIKTVYIPETVKTIDENAFGEDVTIIQEADVPETTITVSSENYKDDEFTLSSSDTFRKYLAGYINFTTVGMEFIMLIGFIYLITDTIITKYYKKNNLENPLSGNFVKIFLSIGIAGLVVTTINTQILKIFLAAWNGREFLILWIPRAIEEIIVCAVQAYMITILYNIYVTKIAPKFTNKI